MRRDFTYIDDIVEGIIRLLDKSEGNKTKLHSGGAPTKSITLETINQ